MRELNLLGACLDDLARRARALPACTGCQGLECPAAELGCPSGLLLATLAERPAGERR